MATRMHTKLTKLTAIGEKLRKKHSLQERLDLVENYKNRPGTAPVSLALFEKFAIWRDAPLRYQIE